MHEPGRCCHFRLSLLLQTMTTDLHGEGHEKTVLHNTGPLKQKNWRLKGWWFNLHTSRMNQGGGSAASLAPTPVTAEMPLGN